MSLIELCLLAAIWGASFLFMHVGSAYAASVTFLIPIFGVLWGAMFLDETITPRMIVGGATILVGTALASGKLRSMRARAT